MKVRVLGLFVSFILSLLGSLPSEAKFAFTVKNKEVYRLVYELKIQEAEALLASCQAEDPHNGVHAYLANYICLLKLFAADDANAYTKAKLLERDHLSFLRQLEKDSPYNLFFQAEIKLQWALLKFRFRDEIGAGMAVRQANVLIAENQKKFPAFVLNNKTAGILNVVLGNVPDAYQSTMRMIGMGGSIPLGISQLQKAANHDSPLQQECQLLLLLARSYVLKENISVTSELLRMVQAEPQKRLLGFMAAGMLLTSNNAEVAYRLLLDMPTNAGILPFPLYHKMLGDCYLYRQELGKADASYQRFLSQYKGKHYLKDTYYRLFLCHWLRSDTLKAKVFLTKIRKNGYAVLESDKRAERFVHNGERLQPLLTTSRLQYDGGYYDEAWQTLDRFVLQPATPLKDVVEYHYRKGRILHAQLHQREAIQAYQDALRANGTVDKYYFAPSAALQLGYLFSDSKDYVAARKYFLLAQRYKNHEYYNSITYKAKEGIRKLNLVTSVSK